MPTIAAIAPEGLFTGSATAASAFTALAPGRTAPEESSFRLQVWIGIPCTKACPAIPFPGGTQATISCTLGGILTAATNSSPFPCSDWTCQWIVPATAPCEARNSANHFWNLIWIISKTLPQRTQSAQSEDQNLTAEFAETSRGRRKKPSWAKSNRDRHQFPSISSHTEAHYRILSALIERGGMTRAPHR